MVDLIKHDLVAPGMCYTAPASSGSQSQWLSAVSGYQFFNGTSSATPYTAGVIALMLQRKPTLTAAEFKALLKDGGATKDKFTGDVPNGLWGRGKLDYAAAERLLAKVK